MFGVTCKAGSQYGVTPMNEWEGGGEYACVHGNSLGLHSCARCVNALHCTVNQALSVRKKQTINKQ